MLNRRLKKDFELYLKKERESAYSYSPNHSCCPKAPRYTYKPYPKATLIQYNGGVDDITEWGLNPLSFNDECNIFFYDITKTYKYTKHYTSLRSFFLSLGEDGVDKIKSIDKIDLKTYHVPYFICYSKDGKEIIVRRSKTAIEPYLNGKEEISTTSTPPPLPNTTVTGVSTTVVNNKISKTIQPLIPLLPFQNKQYKESYIS